MVGFHYKIKLPVKLYGIQCVRGDNHEKQKNAEKNPDRSWYPCDSMPVGLRGLGGLAIHYGEGYLQ